MAHHTIVSFAYLFIKLLTFSLLYLALLLHNNINTKPKCPLYIILKIKFCFLIQNWTKTEGQGTDRVSVKVGYEALAITGKKCFLSWSTAVLYHEHIYLLEHRSYYTTFSPLITSDSACMHSFFIGDVEHTASMILLY